MFQRFEIFEIQNITFFKSPISGWIKKLNKVYLRSRLFKYTEDTLTRVLYPIRYLKNHGWEVRAPFACEGSVKYEMWIAR